MFISYYLNVHIHKQLLHQVFLIVSLCQAQSHKSSHEVKLYHTCKHIRILVNFQEYFL